MIHVCFQTPQTTCLVILPGLKPCMSSFYCRLSETRRSHKTRLQPPTLRNSPCRLEQKSETQKPDYKSLRIANPRLPALWLIFRRHCHRNPEFPTSLIMHNTIKSFQPNCMLHGKSSGDTLAMRDDELHNCKRWFMIVSNNTKTRCSAYPASANVAFCDAFLVSSHNHET